MRIVPFDLSQFRRGGARRVRRADDLAGDLYGGIARGVLDAGKLGPLFEREGLLPPIGGGMAAGAQYQNTVWNTAAFAASPGTVLQGTLYSAEYGVVLAVGIATPALLTAAANGISFYYGNTAALGAAATGGTIFPTTNGTQPTTTAIQQTVASIQPVPAAGLNAGVVVVGIGAGAIVANANCFFGLIGLS